MAETAVLGRVANVAPEFDEGGTATRSLAEDAVSGSWVGDAVTATDPEEDTLTYSLANGTDAEQFVVDAFSGRLEVASGAFLDYETDPSLEVVVQVSDGLGADHNPDTAIDDTITVTVSLTNADEAGRVSLSSLEPEAWTALTAALTDPDGSISGESWQWVKSSDGGSNWTDITGASSETYTPTSADAGAFLRATVSYTDGEGSGKNASRQSTSEVQSSGVQPLEDPTDSTQIPQQVDTSLESLSLASIPFSFDGETLLYEVSTPYSDHRTKVTTVPTADSGVSVSIYPSDSRPANNGHQVDLRVGNNNIVVTVTHDQSGSSRTYLVRVNRQSLLQIPQDDCMSGMVDMVSVHCGSTAFADYRVERNGSYTIDWSKWDENHADLPRGRPEGERRPVEERLRKLRIPERQLEL